MKGFNGAATRFFFLIVFTNNGATSCSLSGVPRAQAVEGPSKTPVGFVAKYAPSGSVRSGTVVLRAHGGKAYVEYYVMSVSDWTVAQCRPAIANGMLLNLRGTGRFYLPITRRGATEVCTKLASTEIGAFSPTTY
jgi:hypothetical protein